MVQLEPCTFDKKVRNLALETSFDLENMDLESPNLHLKEFLYGPTYHSNFVFLVFTGADIAGGQIVPPPFSRARNSQTLSRERVKGDMGRHVEIRFCTAEFSNLTVIFVSEFSHSDTLRKTKFWDTAVRSLFAPGGDGLRSVTVVALQAR